MPVMNGTKATDWQEQQIFMVDIDNAEDGVYYCPTFSDTVEQSK